MIKAASRALQRHSYTPCSLFAFQFPKVPSDMSARYFQTLRGSIPSGRQLPRTPPLLDVKRHLDFSIDPPNDGCEELQQQQDVECQQASGGDHDHRHQHGPRETNTDPDEPNSMLKGMKGYELTAGDLEFIEKMKKEKLVKKYQRDLEDVQKLLKKETMALDLACALRDTAEAELNKFPSREDVTEWVKAVLKISFPSADLTDLDTKSLLALVTKEDLQAAMDEKETQLARMENMLANERKKEAEERGRLEKQIAGEQLKIQRLMTQLSDLTSELVQLEVTYKDLQMHKETKVSSAAAAAAAAEEIEQTKKESEAATKKPSKSGKAPRGMKANVQELNSQPSLQAGRGRRRPPRATQAAASQTKMQSQAKAGNAQSASQQAASQQAAPSRGRTKVAMAAGDAVEEAQNAGLRRSRRIASRR